MKSATIKWLWIATLLLANGIACAQTACPPGMIPYGVGVCGYDNTQQQSEQQPQPPPPGRWESRWGALATDGPGGHLGVVTGVSTQEMAERAAKTDCQTKGGTDCDVEVSYRNGCVAMVVGNLEHSSNSAATLDEAIQRSMKVCKSSGDTNCHVHYSACSLPVRIQ